MTDRWPDGEPVIVSHGLTPQHFNQPTCAIARYDPQQVAEQAVATLFDALSASLDQWRTWHGLSITSRRALLDVHAGRRPRLHPSTRACLIRRDLITGQSVITLYGRQVVAEAISNVTISDKVDGRPPDPDSVLARLWAGTW
jgi:hypothetical protein